MLIWYEIHLMLVLTSLLKITNFICIYHLAIATLAITLERSQAVSFAYPIVDTYNQIFIPNFKGINYMALVEPLNTITWMFIGFSCIVTPPFLYITTQ